MATSPRTAVNHAIQPTTLRHLKTGARRVIADGFQDVTGGAALRALSSAGRVLDNVTSMASQPDHFRVNLRYCMPLER